MEQSPSVAGRVLGLAGSAFFARGKPVRSLRDAVVRVLGLELVRNIVLGIAVTGSFEPRRVPGFDGLRYWSSALRTAALARTLAAQLSDRLVGRFDTTEYGPDSAYLGGLLHNLGLLALIEVAPEAMEEVFARAAERDDRSVTRAEQALLEIDHFEVGALLAVRWSLPPAVRIVLSELPDPLAGTRPHALSIVVGLAAAWVRARWFAAPGGEGAGGDSLPGGEALLAAAGLSADEFGTMVAPLEEALDTLAALARSFQ